MGYMPGWRVKLSFERKLEVTLENILAGIKGTIYPILALSPKP